MNMNFLLKNQSGQALISLLFISLIGFTVIFASVILVFNNSLSASITEQGTYAYYIAESGAEEGILRYLRDPLYTGTQAGQPLQVGIGGSAVIQVSSASGLIISTGTFNTTVKKIQVQTVYNNGVLTISSWKEIN
jgi:hypothetical protein